MGLHNHRRSYAGGVVMDLFQHHSYSTLQQDLEAAQRRCQTRKIHDLQRKLTQVMTNILRVECGLAELPPAVKRQERFNNSVNIAGAK